MKCFVGDTDNDWFAFLFTAVTGIDEVNFWQQEQHKAFQRGRRVDPMSFQMDLA
jgi:hypothetical protein